MPWHEPEDRLESDGAVPVDSSSESAPSSAIASEDHALAFLQRHDLQASDFEQLIRNSKLMNSRKVRLAMVKHPLTPRHITLPLLRHLFTFDLMNAALSSTAPADVKNAADDVLISRLDSIPTGERLALARRASGKIAGSLLFDKDSRVVRTALDNSRLTEARLIKTIGNVSAPISMVESVCHHGKWSLRREVRVALLRCDKVPLACALAFARSLPKSIVKEILRGSKLPSNTQRYLRSELHITELV
ncbi:MAG TPA: hypothetical protein VFA68_13730 [Terriglobales bacterium]|nr:hypothetical protein [Terriglobales bacterium]